MLLKSLYPPKSSIVNSKTIQLFVLDQSERLLLVHEKGDEDSGHTRSSSGMTQNKPPGYALPGGGIDPEKSRQYLFDNIWRVLPIYRIDRDFLREILLNDIAEFEIILTAVKEGIEETGFLINPTQILFEEQNAPDHKVIISSGKIIAGEVSKRSIETDDCDFFELTNLPYGIYRSHIRRIIRALKVVGRDDLAAKVTIQEKLQEKKTLEAV